MAPAFDVAYQPTPYEEENFHRSYGIDSFFSPFTRFRWYAMTQEMSDMLFGAGILALFLVIVFVLGYGINRLKNARFTRTWQPLIPLIDGKVVEDGGGAATSWLTGTYKGTAVYASIVPNRNRYAMTDDTGGHVYNYFEVGVQNVRGQFAWSVEHKEGVLGFGHKGWTATSENKKLAADLERSGVVEEISRYHPMTVEYNPRTKTLRFTEDVTPLLLPPNDRVQQELDLLLNIAQLNERLNAS